MQSQRPPIHRTALWGLLQVLLKIAEAAAEEQRMARESSLAFSWAILQQSNLM